ncbi:MAG: hypothetical protein ACRDKG_15220, partial [Actinomycetota bacterium]
LFAHRFEREETPVDIGAAVDEWIAAKRRVRSDAQRIEELGVLIHDYCERTGLERLFGRDAAVTRVTREDGAFDLHLREERRR